MSGCADGPDERYMKALQASAALRDAPKEEKPKALDDLLHFFDARSADVFRGAWQAGKRASRYGWTNVQKLLIEGTVAEVKDDGDMRLLTVENEKGKKFEVRMINEGGLWVIDGLALQRFWTRLQKVEL